MTLRFLHNFLKILFPYIIPKFFRFVNFFKISSVFEIVQKFFNDIGIFQYLKIYFYNFPASFFSSLAMFSEVTMKFYKHFFKF